MVSWPIVGIYVYAAFSLGCAVGVLATLTLTRRKRENIANVAGG